MTRNLVLVTVDSLRADHCGFVHPNCNLTPMLDSLAEESIVFENAFAPGPRTPSSMPIINTGEFPSYRSEQSSWQSRWDRIRKHLNTHRTVAERLSDRGYTTVGLTTNPWTHGTGFETGFDHFEELTADDMVNPPLPFRLLEKTMQVGALTERFNWHNKREWFVQWQNQYPNIEKALEGVQMNEPYFLWVFLLDSHQPYLVPRRQREESNAMDIYAGSFQGFREKSDSMSDRTMRRLERAYRDSVRSTDAFVRRLQEDLGKDEPVIVFHSDHGEAFGEHGEYGHQQTLYEENLHVPYLIHGINQSEQVEDIVSLRSIPEVLSTIADDGQIEPNEFTEDFVFAATENMDSWAVRNDRWKFIDDGEQRLFDLQADPEEQNECSEMASGVTQALDKSVAHQRSHATEKDRIGTAVANVPLFRAPQENKS